MRFEKPLSFFLRATALLVFAAAAHAAETYAGVFFSPTSIAAGGTSLFDIQLRENDGTAFTNGSITVSYPAGLVNVPGTPLYFTDCPGSFNITANPGDNQLIVTNVALGAFTACDIYINVTASALGSYTITIPPGTFSSSTPPTTNIQQTSATLDVIGPIFVTNTADSGGGSLRDAINTVNGSCGSTTGINFNIAGSGPFTISPTSELPAITCPGVVIDGYSQPGSARNVNPSGGNTATILIDLNGSACGSCNGLILLGDGILVEGFAIRSFAGVGIVSSPEGGGNTILGNYIGTDPGGMVPFGNFSGIEVDSGYAAIGDGSPGGRNLITANAGTGVLAVSGSVGVGSNQIGGLRDASPGSPNVGNGFNGIILRDANYQSNVITGNLILANTGAGISVEPSTFARVVIEDNESYGNTSLGIDQLADAISNLNDEVAPYDTDGLQNYPVITSVIQSGGNTIVSGYLKSLPTGSADVFLYHNSIPLGNAEGETFIDTFTLTLDANGDGSFTRTIPGLWDNVSAQVTLTLSSCSDCLSTIRSSEYSPKVAATPDVDQTIVTNANDSGPGSLRDAILAVNDFCQPKRLSRTPNQVDRAFVSGTTITFNISGGGLWTIVPATPLPPIMCDNTVIDAYTQPGSVPNTSITTDNAIHNIILDGFDVTGDGFVIIGANVTIRGFEIGDFRTGAAIAFAGPPGTPGPLVLGNLIGTDATGTVRTKNSYGVANNTGAVGMQIGTGNLYDRNIIAGNDTGVRLLTGDLTVIQGNWIGVGPHGNIAMANDTGIIVSGGSTRTAIVGNLISGNLAEGIVLQSSSGTTILANKIGTAANGFAPVPNGWDGISFLTPDAFGSVGDGTAANGNLITANQHYGVHVASTGVSVLGNSIFSNVGLGIDLNTSGVVPANDTCDADAGANGLQNFPVITSVTIFSDHTNISGTFESTAGNTFRMEFFQNFPGDNPGNRGGRNFIGSAPVATTLTPSCVAPFSVDLPVILSPGDLVTATATDPTGSTSWFSLATGAVVSSPGVSLSASTLDFGALLVNTVSAPLTVTLTNTGNATLNISSVSASIPFSIASQTCGATLAATASCTYDITFGPTAPGTYTGLFTLTSDAPATPTATVNLVGVGMSAPSFALVTPTGLTPGQTVPIAIQISNPAGNPASYGNFTMATLTYPVGYTNAAPGGGLPAGGCGDPSFTGGVGGGTTIGFGPGAGSVAPGTTCSIVAAQLVAPATIGSYTFTIPPGGITVSSPFVYSNPTAIIVTANVFAAPVPGITISPSSVPFPSTVVGTSSTPVSLSINNSGNAPLNISLVTATGDFTSVNGCVGPIAPTASCSITVTFTPTAAGPRNGTLTITSDAPGSPHTVPLSGTGVVLTPGVAINPPSLVFPSQNVGTPSAAQTVSITNTGTGPLHISSVTTSGDFSNNAACPSTINPGPTNACVFTVTFTPTIAGPRTGTLTVTSDAVGSPHSAALSGTGIALAPAVSLTPPSLTFASRTVGTTSPLQVITMANTGNGPLTITSITGAGDYAFTSSCGATLAALASCAINVTFTPLAAGPRPGSLVIVDDAPGSPRIVPLTGSGVAGVAAVPMVSPGSLDFDSQAVGSSSAVQLVVVSNAGTGPLDVSSFSVTGEFSTAPPPGTPPVPCPATIAPGSACAIGVIFRPAGTNLRQGVLTIATNAGTLTVNVSGIGMVAEPPQLTMPLALDFGSRTIGITGDGLALPMHNTSPYVAAIHELTATGDFDVSDTCATIPVAGSCSLLVTFLPTQVGARTGTLTVRTMRDANPYVVSLTGVGIENVLPSIQASPIRVGFGNVFVGGNASQIVTLRNAGRGPLHVSGVLFTGDFSASASCVGTIQPGASCAVNITFSPMIPGGRPGVMQILSDDPNGTLDVSLSGAGCYLPTPSHARAGLPLCGS